IECPYGSQVSAIEGARFTTRQRFARAITQETAALGAVALKRNMDSAAIRSPYSRLIRLRIRFRLWKQLPALRKK
ncbi:MAG TPA: hypothetical protein VIG78_04975, partial [Gemmatimonadaceae bacterium]